MVDIPAAFCDLVAALTYFFSLVSCDTAAIRRVHSNINIVPIYAGKSTGRALAYCLPDFLGFSVVKIYPRLLPGAECLGTAINTSFGMKTLI